MGSIISQIKYRRLNHETRVTFVLILTVACLLTGCTNRTAEILNASNNWTTQERADKFIVGLQLQPGTPQHNALFVTLRNNQGEPINDASVVIRSIKQFMFTTDATLPSKLVEVGTYRIETDLTEGNSEINLAITPPNGKTTNLRMEANLRREIAPEHPFLLIK